MSYMSELAVALDDLREGHPLDAEQAEMVRRYTEYLRSPVARARIAQLRGEQP